MRVKVTVTFDRDGNAIIKAGEGKAMKMEAMKAANFTEKLANNMGKIIERHKGEHQAELDTKNDIRLNEGD